MARSDQYERGVARFKELFGIEPRLGVLSEDFMEITMEYLFGNIWNRPELELKERSLITMAALIVLGREMELKTHMRGALNIGISKEKITEMIIHLAHYGGWPVAVGGLRVAQQVFEGPEKKKD
jgi:4-carboxymuconolactone decarboxylase